MPTITVSTFVTVPFLALLSIPLVLAAYLTICFSVLALFIRLSVIYIELSYAIITNYFVIPTSHNSSFLTFAASEPTTPTQRRRSSDYESSVNYNLFRSASGRQLRLAVPPGGNNTITTTTSTATATVTTTNNNHNAKPRPAIRRHNSSNSFEGYQLQRRSREARNNNNNNNNGNGNGNKHASVSPPSAPFLSLISGDEGRDFEGVGGWRCPPASSRSGHPSRSASSSSSSTPSDHGLNTEEADERAWLSINNRLELPSQPFISESPPQQRGRRHHQRSITTSLVTGSNYGTGLSIDRNTVQRLRSSPTRRKKEKPKKE